MNMIIMIGLAVGIDYSLFIVERFREERADGLDKVDAITRAGATASRAVLFSGITVIIALAGLLIIPSTSFHGLALGAIAAVIGAVLAAMTLLPAALSLLGDKINALHLPGRGKVATRADDGRLLGRRHPRRHAPPGDRHRRRRSPSSALLPLPGYDHEARLARHQPTCRRTSTPSRRSTSSTTTSAPAASPRSTSSSGRRRTPPRSRQAVATLIERHRRRTPASARFTDLEVSDDGRTGLVQVYVNGDSIGERRPERRAAASQRLHPAGLRRHRRQGPRRWRHRRDRSTTSTR